MFEAVLIANRGEIACRIARTCQRMGIRAIAVHSEADGGARHVAAADQSVLLAPAASASSYLDVARVIEVARQTGVQAIHPGYGFLAENAEFAQAVLDAGLVWVGPAPESIRLMGDKINARAVAANAGVPVAAGTALPITEAEDAALAASDLGFPLMVKAATGGGGIGMGVARDAAELRAAFETARTRAERFFCSPAILLERYIEQARHIEVQVLGLADGRVVTLGERECSVQRRHQKLAEESPSPAVSPELRTRLLDAAVRLAQAVGYRNAGTVEFLLDVRTQEFVFLEMNARLQVEHPVTELVMGVDLVEQQLRIAAGLDPSYDLARPSRGHAIELRICAEDPRSFRPSPGAITRWEEPVGPGVRVDSGYGEGDVVTPFYDPLLAKLAVWGSTRDEAVRAARQAVADFVIEGPRVNLPFHAELLAYSEFATGSYDTCLVERMRATS